jgi:hypothetical protein
MRKLSWLITAGLVIAAAINLAATPLSAAPAGTTAINATPLLHPVQYDPWSEYGSYGYGWGYRPACPTSYQYSCWSDAYGFHHCGCLLNPRRWWWW